MDSKKIISSPNQLYNIIKDLKIEDPILKKFKDHMFQFFNGCSCNAESNWNAAVVMYKLLNRSESLKSIVGATSIEIYLDQVRLFSL